MEIWGELFFLHGSLLSGNLLRNFELPLLLRMLVCVLMKPPSSVCISLPYTLNLEIASRQRIGTVIRLTSFISLLSKITILHCLLSNI